MDCFQRFVFFMLILQFGSESAEALYGYDCSDQLTNITTISLVDVGECHIEAPEVETTKKSVQLVQLNDFGLTHVYKCSLKITRIITHCGMHSHASRVQDGEISYFKELSRDECMRIQETGFYTLAGTPYMDIPRNGSLNRPITLAGSANKEGSCKGSTYVDPYGKWDEVYVAGWMEVRLSDYYARVQMEADRINLQSGRRCKYSDLSCVDADAAYTFWSDLPEGTCGNNRYSVLYEGPVTKIKEKGTNKIMYTLASDDFTFALWQKGESNVCGFKLSRTEHPKLFVLEDTNESKFLTQGSKATNLEIFQYMNSKFVYVEKYVGEQVDKLYYDILRKECELERKVLSNALAIAATSPDEAGYRIMEQTGYVGILAGEVIHLVKCLPVELTRRKTSKCYAELPVFRGKQEFFLAPRTRVLLRTGRQIHCDTRMPAMFKLNEVWIRLLPEAIDAKTPEILAPKTKPTWRYHNAETLATGGIYSDKDLNQLWDMILFPMEKPAILNKIALGVSGRTINNHGLTLRNLMDQETLEALADSTWNKMWSSFLAFGTASAGIIGLFMFGRLIKLLVDTLIHGYAIYSLYGFSLHIIGAVWNSVTQLLLHLGNERQRRAEREKSKSEEGETKELEIQEEEITSRKDEKEDKRVGLYPFLPTGPPRSVSV